MPTLTAARGESKKKEARANVDFSAIWEVVSADLVQDEVRYAYTNIDLLRHTCTCMHFLA